MVNRAGTCGEGHLLLLTPRMRSQTDDVNLPHPPAHPIVNSHAPHRAQRIPHMQHLRDLRKRHAQTSRRHDNLQVCCAQQPVLVLVATMSVDLQLHGASLQIDSDGSSHHKIGCTVSFGIDTDGRSQNSYSSGIDTDGRSQQTLGL